MLGKTSVLKAHELFWRGAATELSKSAPLGSKRLRHGHQEGLCVIQQLP